MRVDDVWTPDDDALFAALRHRKAVTVQILRHGLPRTYEYRLAE